MSVRSFVLSIAALALVSTPAMAQPVELNDGFFFRYSTGFGYASSTTHNDLNPMTASGAGFEWELVFGTALSPWFAVHTALFGTIVSKPSVVLGDEYVWEAPETTLSQATLAPGVSFYLGQTGIVLSSSVGPSWIKLTNDSPDFVPHFNVIGVGGEVLLSKEFQPFQYGRFGLGISFTFHSVPATENDPSFFGYGLGARLTATIN